MELLADGSIFRHGACQHGLGAHPFCDASRKIAAKAHDVRKPAALRIWNVTNRTLNVSAILLIAFAAGQIAVCQTFPEPTIRMKWSAEWISHPTAPLREPGVFHFRKVINLRVAPEHFLVHVSADNRFVLFANGKRVGEGPARGNFFRWRYETVDLAPFLSRGDSVAVWHLRSRRADYRPPRFPFGGRHKCGRNHKHRLKLGSGGGTWTYRHSSPAGNHAPVLGCWT